MEQAVCHISRALRNTKRRLKCMNENTRKGLTPARRGHGVFIQKCWGSPSQYEPGETWERGGRKGKAKQETRSNGPHYKKVSSAKRKGSRAMESDFTATMTLVGCRIHGGKRKMAVEGETDALVREGKKE